MTSIRLRAADPAARVALLLGGLTAVVLGRWAATIGLPGSALAVGLAFGLALLGLAVIADRSWAIDLRAIPGRSAMIAVAIGICGGIALIALAFVARIVAPAQVLAGQSAWIQTALLPWAAITVLVASAEELLLRGVLFSAIEASGGQLAAVVVTSLVFALMHVPLYGWHVVPLDLGVGIWLAGLRLLSGGVVAPAIAHAVADLATAWL